MQHWHVDNVAATVQMRWHKRWHRISSVTRGQLPKALATAEAGQHTLLLQPLLLLLLLPLPAGALLPAILHQVGLITYSQELSTLLEQQQQQLPQGADERALRAAAVAAVDEIVAAAAATAAGGGAGGEAGFTARDLSSYLLSLVVEEGQQQLLDGAVLRPHRTVGTVAY